MKKRIILIIVFMVLVAGFLLVSETVSAMVAAFSLSAGADGGWSPDDLLMPTGNSTQDTANLQAAIHDSRMDAGGTLYLGPGTFLVHNSLVRQAFDPNGFGYNPVLFNGTIQGAGKGVTIIRSVRGPGGVPFTPFMAYPITFFILDLDYFGVRDMTFEADSEIADPYWYAGHYTRGLLSYVNLGSGMYGVGNQIGTDCINVHFKGCLDSSGKPEIPYMFEPYGGGGGTHNCKSCEFENGLVSLLKYALFANATINIGGSPGEKVTFTNALGGSVTTQSCGNCTVNVSHIETNDAPGLYFSTHPENVHSSVTMTHSNINMRPDSWWGGAEIWARYGEVSAVISHNKIHSPSHIPPFGPIFGQGIGGAEVMNNIITGKGHSAIYVSGYITSRNGIVINNNLSGFHPKSSKYSMRGIPPAHAYFGPATGGFLFIGDGDFKIIVLDLGWDNTITGAIHIQMGKPDNPPGLEMLQKKKEMIENLWK